MAKKSGYGADATLVAAGFKLGQSNIPGDYSKIFEKQYEGLIAANKARAEGKAKASKAFTDNVGDFVETLGKKEKEDDDFLEQFNKDMNEVGNTYTDQVAKDFATDMEEGRSLPDSQFDAADNAMSGIVSQYETLTNITFKTQQQKKDLKALKKQMLEFRPAIIKSRADQTTKATLWGNGGINKDQSFKGQPNLQALYSLSIDKNYSTDQLKKLGVEIKWQNGVKSYEYTDGLWGALYGDISNGGPEGTDVIPAEAKEKTSITEKDLLAMLKPKDEKSVKDMNGIQSKLMTEINSYETNLENNTKVRTIKDFAEVKDGIKKEFKNAALLSDNPEDIYTRTILIGNTDRNYKTDLESNTGISAATALAMGKNKFNWQKKHLKDGVISPEELETYKLKKEILEILTNPKTAEHKEIAASQYAEYRTKMLEGVFNAKRERIDAAVKFETDEEKAKKELVYQQNSIFIQEQFIAAEKKGFTLDILNGLPIDKNKQFVEINGKVYLAYKTSVGDEYKMVSDSPIDLSDKQSVLNILYQNSKIRPRERNIKLTGRKTSQANYVNTKEYLNKFIINQ